MDITNWMLVMMRAGGFLALFPVFSITDIPVQIRVALGALLALLIAPSLPPSDAASMDLWRLLGAMGIEIGVGLLLGFVSRMVWYALDVAGGLLGAEIGWSIPSSLNPMSTGQTTEATTLLQYVSAMLFLTLNLHHGMLAAFQYTYHYLPLGGAHLRESLLLDVVARTGHIFLFAVQVSAPLIAVSFVITLVFAVLGRAVPQMNVFSESFGVRLLAGLIVFGLTLQLMGQHIANYLRRLPADMLTLARLLGTA